MKTNELLLRTVLEHPDDDVARLIYADWLEENEEEDYAKLIRWQIADHSRDFSYRNGRWRGSVKVEDPCMWRALNAFLSEDLPRPFTVWRGFVCSVETTLTDLLYNVEYLFNTHPLTYVDIEGAVPYYNGSGYAWYDASRPRPVTTVPISANVPPEIFSNLNLHTVGRSRRWIGYPTMFAALSALSAACIAYGRECAKLSFYKPA